MRFLSPVALLLIAIVGCSSPAQGSGPAAAHLTTTVQELRAGQVIDGVPCLREDLPSRHIHVHLEILLDGVPVTVPAGIGVGRPWGLGPDGFIATGSCFAWIHTHDASGVVHIVTPEEKAYTLGQLFAVWGQPLGTTLALGYDGALAVFVNGLLFDGDPGSVTLANLKNIVIELGRAPATPAPALYDFGGAMRR